MHVLANSSSMQSFYMYMYMSYFLLTRLFQLLLEQFLRSPELFLLMLVLCGQGSPGNLQTSQME